MVAFFKEIGRLEISIAGIIALLFIAVIPFHIPIAHAEMESSGGYVMEMLLDPPERLDAIRYLQARILQPYSNGRYFVRGVRVLLPADSNVGVFAYLVTFQIHVPANQAYDLGNSYTTAGYYLILLSRETDEFTIINKFPLTPIELTQRLGFTRIPPSPELTSDQDKFDFTDAVFNASDPDLIEWREHLIEYTSPRWEWMDVTNDGLIDCILDIEGFEFQPTSYYTIFITTSDGLTEGFRSWDYNTDFTEIVRDGQTTIKADRYSISASGDFFPSWRDFYTWNGSRFIIANLNFSGHYSDLVPSLNELISQSIAAELDDDGRWSGLPRFVINVVRYSENLGTPSEYYFNLARIAEYRFDNEDAIGWWRELAEYLDGDYDSQSLVDIDSLDKAIQDSIQEYTEWRDELYYAAEVALAGK